MEASVGLRTTGTVWGCIFILAEKSVFTPPPRLSAVDNSLLSTARAPRFLCGERKSRFLNAPYLQRPYKEKRCSLLLF